MHLCRCTAILIFLEQAILLVTSRGASPESSHMAVTWAGTAGMQRLTGPCPGAWLIPLQQPYWGTEFSAVTEVTL